MTNLDFFWMSNEDWIDYDEDEGFVIKDDAPQEAQESYKRYIKQLESASERGAV